VYYCFGCGAGGDAVRFLQQIENLTFVEAVERLASDVGIKLTYEGVSAAEKKAASRRAALHKANEEAAGLFHEALLESKEAEPVRAYLAERGIGSDAIEAFGIGYAPRSADFLQRAFSRRISSDLLAEAGLVTRDGEGRMRDRFRGRLTFPIRDLSGRSVGFGARILPGADPNMAKYVNTAETPIYRKGDLLYNLDRAKGSITRSGQVFVVEGYTDVIALAEAGIDNAVATCGTALSEGHLRLLSRFAQTAVLTFDGDEAGARAAERAFAFHEDVPVQEMVLIVPDGLDPADFVAQRGAEAFRELATGARPLVEYMVRRVIGRADLSNVEGRTRAVEAAFPIVDGLKDPVRRQEYAHLVAELAGVDESSVMLKLKQPPRARAGTAPAREGRAPVQDRVEREMLKLLARDADTFREYSGRVGEDDFQSAGNRRLLAALIACGGDLRAASAQDEKVVKQLSQLALEPMEGDPSPSYAQAVFSRLQELSLQRRSDDLRRELQKLNPTTDAGYDEMFGQLIALDGELRRLREAAAAEGRL
jgi:DNA primase